MCLSPDFHYYWRETWLQGGGGGEGNVGGVGESREGKGREGGIIGRERPRRVPLILAFVKSNIRIRP